jgi:enamine deaminase RidA (YjgF/YER057c/UK114 family)
MDTVKYLNPAELHRNPAFSQAVRIPAGHDLIVIGGQNGVDSSGRVVAEDIGGQTRQALSNLQACLSEANADLDHVVHWSILIKDGAPLMEGFAAFMEVWGQRANPPAITGAFVSGLAVPGALVEINALAAVPSA